MKDPQAEPRDVYLSWRGILSTRTSLSTGTGPRQVLPWQYLLHPSVQRGPILTSATTELHPSLAPKGRSAKSKQPPARIVIQYPQPAVDGGQYPAKRCVGDTVVVSADIFRDGHDILRAVVRYRPP